MVPTPTKWIRFFLSCLLLIIRRSVTSVLRSRRKRSRPPLLYLPIVRSWSTCMRDARPSTPLSNPWRSTTASAKLVRTSASDRWPDGLAKRADSGAQFGFRSGAGMIVADHARTIDQHQRGRSTSAVGDEIRRAQRYRHLG